jgi:hypothetical protein
MRLELRAPQPLMSVVFGGILTVATFLAAGIQTVSDSPAVTVDALASVGFEGTLTLARLAIPTTMRSKWVFGLPCSVGKSREPSSVGQCCFDTSSRGLATGMMRCSWSLVVNFH